MIATHNHRRALSPCGNPSIRALQGARRCLHMGRPAGASHERQSSGSGSALPSRETPNTTSQRLREDNDPHDQPGWALNTNRRD